MQSGMSARADGKRLLCDRLAVILHSFIAKFIRLSSQYPHDAGLWEARRMHFAVMSIYNKWLVTCMLAISLRLEHNAL